MTEAEILDSMYSAAANGLSTLAIFITIVGSYIAVAYTVGKKLSSSQVLIINSLYVMFSGVGLASIWAYFSAGARFQDALVEISSFVLASDIDMHLASVTVIVICLIAVAGGLKFMWDIRRDI